MKEEIKAGIIIAASLAVLSVFVVLIGGSQLIDSFDKYYVRVLNAAGLEAGAQVKLGGVRVGRILSIREPDGPGKPVTIEIGIKRGTPIYKGTRALVTQIGFVGDIYLLLSVDKTTNELIRAGEDIPADATVEFTTIMAKLNTLSESVDGLIKDVDRLFSQDNVQKVERLLVNTDKSIVSGAASLEKVSKGLIAASSKLEQVMNELEGIMKDNKGEFSQLIKKAREDIEKAGDMIKSLDETARSVGRTSGSIDKAVALQSRNLDRLLNSMSDTTEEIHQLLQEIKNKPWSIIYQEKGVE
ncbi:MAG: MCE family protein [Nitrospirae bacterium]|nr:MAG: MCE family protein [Nitrospirota bacterium]